MRVARGRAWSRLVSCTDDEKDWLGGYLTFRNERAYWSGGPPEYSLLRRDGSFPSGLLRQILSRAVEANIEVVVDDQRGEKPLYDTAAWPEWLRPYQADGLTAAIEHSNGLLWIPTGGGKTEVFCGLAKMYSSERWLLLVHRAILARQAAERFEKRTGERAGVVGDGERCVERVTCATFQSAASMPDLLKVGGLVVDEAHTLPANTFFKTVMGCDAYLRIGLSGTPLARDDRRSVMAVAALGPVIYRVRPEVLIEAGVLARPRIRMVTLAQQSQRPTWQGVYGELVVRSKIRNDLVVRMAKRAGQPFLVFVKEVRHGRELTDTLRKAGLTVEFVWGARDGAARDRAIKDLERGALDGVVCSVVFQEGVDIPCLRSVIIASGGKSVIAAIQRVGRGSRVEKGKDEFEVWDVMDDGNPMTTRHAKRRRKAYEGEGYAVEVCDGL